MVKPATPNIPGLSAMTDTLEFMKNMWGGMSAPGIGIPGMVMPTLSVEEIDKQIKDLKAVESWLTVNMNMLRGTIQALEVQSATISTLQSMGQTFSAAMNPEAAQKSAPARPFSQAASRSAATEEQAAEPKPSRDELKAEFKADAKPQEKPAAKPQAPSDNAAFAAPLANPAMWWNMLQDQFKQAVNTAMASEAAAPAPAPAKAPAAKPKAKPAAAPRKRKAPAKKS